MLPSHTLLCMSSAGRGVINYCLLIFCAHSVSILPSLPHMHSSGFCILCHQRALVTMNPPRGHAICALKSWTPTPALSLCSFPLCSLLSALLPSPLPHQAWLSSLSLPPFSPPNKALKANRGFCQDCDLSTR